MAVYVPGFGRTNTVSSMKSLLSLCLLIALTLAASAQETPGAAPSAPPTPSAPTSGQETRIAAVINNDIVTVDDLAARLNLVMRSSGIADTPENRQRLNARVLRQLIDEKLEMQEAKKQKISVTKDEVDDAYNNIETRNNMPKGGLDAYLKQQGVSRQSLIDQLTASLTWSKTVRDRWSSEVSVSDDEVNDALKQLKADIGKPQSRVSEIFLAVDNPTQEDEVRRLADRLIEQIRGGANFGAVAQQFSQSPSAATGGDIGWVTPNELSASLGEAVEKMKPGEMSYPIRTAAGFYLLYVADRKTLGATSPDDTEFSLVEVVFPLAPSAAPEERQRIEAQAQDVANTAKSCGEMAKIGVDRAPQLSTQIPSVKAGDLPPDLRQTVMALKVAEASKPLELRGGIGTVMVCQRKDPDSGLPSADQIADNIARMRLDQLARRYLRDLRRSAYVDIR
jgi:peptidyl-prolyl cis-trans isomerase SurA